MIQLTPREREIVAAILIRRVPSCEVWAFGSRVKGRPRPFSDLDLAVRGPSALPAGVLASLAEDFSESDLDFKVDVLDWAAISPVFRQAISASRELIQAASSGGGPISA